LEPSAPVTVFASKVTDLDYRRSARQHGGELRLSVSQLIKRRQLPARFQPTMQPDVALNSTITINFSEQVNVASGGVTINCGSAVSFTPALPQSSLTTLVLTPDRRPPGLVETVL
jgi:hypothetical protein